MQACGVDLGIGISLKGNVLYCIYIDKPVDENAEPIINEDGEEEQVWHRRTRLCECVTQQVGGNDGCP